MSGSRMRSTSPIDGVAVPLPSIDDDEIGGKGKGVAPGNKPSLGRRVSVRRGRGTDIGFGGYEHATFTAGIMQRLDALHPDEAAEDLGMAALPRLEAPAQDYFNYYDRASNPTPVEDALQVEELDRALEVEAIHQHEEMDGVVPEAATLYEVEVKGKGLLQPDVAQEEVEGEWFDGVTTEQGELIDDCCQWPSILTNEFFLQKLLLYGLLFPKSAPYHLRLSEPRAPIVLKKRLSEVNSLLRLDCSTSCDRCLGSNR